MEYMRRELEIEKKRAGFGTPPKNYYTIYYQNCEINVFGDTPMDKIWHLLMEIDDVFFPIREEKEGKK